MEQVDVLRDAAARLDQLRLPWMLVDSYASGYYGEPRFAAVGLEVWDDLQRLLQQADEFP